MKRILFLTLALAGMMAYSFAQNYVFLTRVNEADNVSVGAVALSDSGDIYYGQFNAAASKVVQLNDILTGGNYNPGFATNTVSTETKIATAGRGLNDIKIDSSGNVYISGTGDNAANTILKKFGPEPTHSVLWEMGAGALTGGEEVRINGIEILDGSTLLIGVAFNNLGFKSLATGANTIANVSAGAIYQRSFALNTANNDIYVGRNGDPGNDPNRTSLNLMSGGTPAAPASYTATSYLLPQTGTPPEQAFGVATQALDYIPGDNKLVISDKLEAGARIYSITGSGAGTTFNSLQLLDGEVANEYSGITSLAYNTIGGKKFIVVGANIGVAPDPITYVVDIYIEAPTAEDLWMQY